MRILFLSLMCFVGMYGASYNLKAIEAHIQKHGTIAQAIAYEKKALQERLRAQSAREAPTLSLETARANPQGSPSGSEYAFSVSQTYLFDEVRMIQRRIAQLQNEATLIERSKQMNAYLNTVRLRYHEHCLDRQNLQSFSASLRNFGKLLEKKRKAYRFEEISKAELMRLESAYERLKAQKTALAMQVKRSKEQLAALAGLASAQTRLICKDLYPIRATYPLKGALELSKRSFDKAIESTAEEAKRYEKNFDSIEIYGGVSEELDVRRVQIGVSVPLNALSNRYEAKRAEAMYRQSALKYQKSQRLQELKSQIASYKEMLRIEAHNVRALTKQIKRFDTQLLRMSKRSFELGEISALEYLLDTNRRYELLEQLHQSKRRYYQTLFTLLTTAEIKDIR